jgi:hypothetical protein
LSLGDGIVAIRNFQPKPASEFHILCDADLSCSLQENEMVLKMLSGTTAQSCIQLRLELISGGSPNLCTETMFDRANDVIQLVCSLDASGSFVYLTSLEGVNIHMAATPSPMPKAAVTLFDDRAKELFKAMALKRAELKDLTIKWKRLRKEKKRIYPGYSTWSSSFTFGANSRYGHDGRRIMVNSVVSEHVLVSADYERVYTL